MELAINTTVRVHFFDSVGNMRKITQGMIIIIIISLTTSFNTLLNKISLLIMYGQINIKVSKGIYVAFFLGKFSARE